MSSTPFVVRTKQTPLSCISALVPSTTLMSDTEAEATGTPTRLIAVHNFPKEQPQDLPLVKGSLYLGSYLKDEWWVGIDPETGQEGCFPANFVADEDSEAAHKAIARVKAKAKKARQKAAAAAAAAAALAVDEDGVKGDGVEGDGAEGKDFDTVELEITDDAVEPSGSGGGGESSMTSGEAAAAAAEKAISAAAATVEMHADSKLRNLKSMIVIRLVKWFVALLVFSCVAGSKYHLLNLDQENTVDTIFKTGLWRVKSAVSFTVAWGVFMWIFEGSMALFFIAWREGYVDPTLNNKFDINNLSIVLLMYDTLCFFLIIVAGFNMGAAAGIPASAVELLLKQDGVAGITISNNCTAETLGYTKTYVEFPHGNLTDYQNLQTGKFVLSLSARVQSVVSKRTAMMSIDFAFYFRKAYLLNAHVFFWLRGGPYFN